MDNERHIELLMEISEKLTIIHEDFMNLRGSNQKMKDNAIKRQKQAQKRVEKITKTLPPQMRDMVNSMVNTGIVEEGDTDNGN